MIRVSGNALRNIKEIWQGRALAVLGRRPCRDTGKASILRPRASACAVYQWKTTVLVPSSERLFCSLLGFQRDSALIARSAARLFWVSDSMSHMTLGGEAGRPNCQYCTALSTKMFRFRVDSGYFTKFPSCGTGRCVWLTCHIGNPALALVWAGVIRGDNLQQHGKRRIISFS